MKDALAIHRWLLAHLVPHEIVRLPRPMTCVAELPISVLAPAMRCISVSIFELAGRKAVAVVSTVADTPRPADVGALLGVRRVRVAPAFVVNRLTDYTDGLVGPLLLPAELPVLLDNRLPTGAEPVYTATGERGTALAISGADLRSALSGDFADLRPSGKRAAVALRH